MSDVDDEFVQNFRRESLRAWKTQGDDSPMVCFLGMRHRVTLAEIRDHFAEHYPHVDLWSVELNYSTAKWEEPPTPEDVAARVAARANHVERQERWERETYERLKLKFEGES